MTQTPIKAEIDLVALEHNCQIAQKMAPNSKQLAMVKANAYGHGLVPVATTLAPYVSGFGVARLSEALQLHKLNLGRDIILMSGFLTQEELTTCSELGFTPVIHHQHQIKLLQQAQLPYPLKIWLKIDTGMGRLGFKLHETPVIYQQLAQMTYIAHPIGIMSHCPNADTNRQPTANQQYQLLTDVIQELPVERSLVNSAALLSGKKTLSMEWIRPGIMLYGASPFDHLSAANLNLKPVMTLKSKIIAINHLQAGDTVGYGSEWVCPEAMPVGVVAIGYGDGYPQPNHAQTPIIIKDQKASIIGRISMDMLTVDLRAIDKVKVGDEVTLWGQGLPIETIAEAADTIAYDLMCRVNQTQARVHFEYTNSN